MRIAEMISIAQPRASRNRFTKTRNCSLLVTTDCSQAAAIWGM